MWKIKYSRENTFRPKLLKPGVIFLSGFNYLIWKIWNNYISLNTKIIETRSVRLSYYLLYYLIAELNRR